MKRWDATSWLLIVSAVLFVVHQFVQLVAKIRMTFLDQYLDPALMMTILLHLLVWERRVVCGDTSIRLSELHIFGYFLLAVIFGEVVFPYFSDKFTADYWDIFSYAFGNIAYVIAQRVSVSSLLRQMKNG